MNKIKYIIQDLSKSIGIGIVFALLICLLVLIYNLAIGFEYYSYLNAIRSVCFIVGALTMMISALLIFSTKSKFDNLNAGYKKHFKSLYIEVVIFLVSVGTLFIGICADYLIFII